MNQHTDTTPCKPCKGSGVRTLGKSIQKTLDALRKLPNQEGGVAEIWKLRGTKPRLMIHRHCVALVKAGLLSKRFEGQKAIFGINKGKE